MPIQRARTKKHRLTVLRKLRATDVLYDKMVYHDTKSREILVELHNHYNTSDKAQYDKVKQIIIELRRVDELVIDCAQKLAPYQSPKLESIEVKSKHEHRYVMRTPNQIKTVDEWASLTGATRAKREELIKESVKSEVVPSIHDFDTDEDDYIEPGMIN